LGEHEVLVLPLGAGRDPLLELAGLVLAQRLHELHRQRERASAPLLSLELRHFCARKLMFVRYASAFVVLPEASAPSTNSSRR